jgi:hypothetical protein
LTRGKPREKSEKQIQNEILAMIKAEPNLFAFKASDRVNRGIPDIIGVAKDYFPSFYATDGCNLIVTRTGAVEKSAGKMFLIEVKRRGGKPTDLQMEMIRRFTAMGAIAFIAESVDQARQRLKTHGLLG